MRHLYLRFLDSDTARLGDVNRVKDLLYELFAREFLSFRFIRQQDSMP